MSITVYFDGKCGLCSKEINHYKKIAPASQFNWVDITKEPSLLNNKEFTVADALQYLHAENAEGNLKVGIEAFILIWHHLPNWAWLGKLASLPLLKNLLSFLYKGFAKWRFSRLSHCQIAKREQY